MITLSLLARILLDAELNNRSDFEDNTFSESVDYLNQYIKDQPSDLSTDNQARLKPLLEGLKQMSSFEKQLSTWNQSENRYSNRPNDPYKKEALNNITDAVMHLSSEKKYFLPGGWRNQDDHSHQMLYQFEKTADGLRFLIFNTGSEGLNLHEQQSSISGERYFPVKGFDIPNPINTKKLQNLLHELTLANLPRQRSYGQDYNANLLYQKINQQLDFLQAKPVHAKELTSFARTTTGEISKKSAQRPIHQLLKVNFDTLENYQEFMLAFKYHALNEFIQLNPEPRHAEINELILAGINNTLRLLDAIALKNPAIINSFLPHLTALKESLQAQEIQDEPNPHQYFQHETYQVTPSPFHHSEPTTNIDIKPLQPYFSVWQLDLAQPLLPQIDELLTLCEQRKGEAPLWIIEHIEQTLLTLPVTDSTHAVFATIQDKDTVDEMKSRIETLQSLYANAVSRQLNQQQRAQCLLTQWRFITWYDCVDLRQEKPTAFHTYLGGFLADVFKAIQYSPYLATHSHQYDAGWKALQKYYQSSRKDNPQAYFEALINENESFKTWLEEQYQAEYGLLSSDEHQAIRHYHKTALYFLTQQFDRSGHLLKDSVLRDYSIAQPFIHCIEEQLRFETFLVNSFQLVLAPANFNQRFHLTGKRDNYSDRNSFSIEFSSPASSLCKFGARYISDSFGLSKSQYDLPSSPAAQALAHEHPTYITSPSNKYSANQIQLHRSGLNSNHAQRAIDKEDFLHRDLWHLRLANTHQVSLTLEFFFAHIEHLKERDLQLYLTANLFEPGLLSNTLENQPEILTLIEALIQKGLNHYRSIDGLLSQESLYFLQLQGDIYRYLASAEPADRAQLAQQRLQQHHETLSRYIDLNTNEAVLASLHQMRLFNGMVLKKYLPDNQQEALYETLFISHFYTQAKANSRYPLDKIAQYEQQKVLVELNHWTLQQPKQQLQNTLKKAIGALHLLTTEQLEAIQGEYPHYSVQENGTTLYQIHAEQGRIYKNNFYYGAVPFEVQTHPLTRLLGLGDQTSCFISAEEDQCEFGTEPHTVRIMRRGRHPNQAWIVQKQWTMAGQTDWYELQPLNTVHSALFYSRYSYPQAHSIHSQLPATLKDAHTWLWVHPRQKGSFITQKNKPVYRLQANQTLEALDEQQQPTGETLISPGAVHKQLAVFENPRFIQANRAINGQGHVHLARYGLTFDLNPSNVLSLPKTTFHLSQPEKPLFKSNVASLFFVDDEKYQQCLVPVQQFYEDKEASKSEEGHYLTTQHDINSYRDNQLLVATNKLWSYDHSEKAITYRIIEGKPQADKAADALYLCYIYLATHDYQKAWDVLNDLSLRLSFDGSQEELLYLSWIINEQKIKSASPRQNACQLKALALYTDFLSQGKKPCLSDPDACDLTTKNGDIQIKNIAQATAFYHYLPSTIAQLYRQHFKTQRHVDVRYQLKDNECQSLLDYHFNQTSNPPHELLCASLDQATENKLKNGYVWDGEKLFYISPDQQIESLPIDDLDAFKALLVQFSILPGHCYALEDSKVFALITQHTQHVPKPQPKAFGAIGYEWRRLSLKTLRREYEKLTHTIDVATEQQQAVPSAMRDRKQAIEAQLEKYEPIMGTQTELELVPIDLSFQKIRSEYWHYDLFEENKPTYSDQEITEALNPDFSISQLTMYLPQLCRIAQNPAATLNQELKLFCKTYLITHAHNPNKQQTAYVYVNLLYHLVENPSVRFDTRWGRGLSILTDAVANTTVPPLYAYQAKNVYQHELAQTQQLWESLAQEVPTAIAMHVEPVKTVTMADVLEQEALSSEKFASFRQQFEQAETLYQTERLTCLTNNDEVGAGQIKYACLETQRQLAKALLTDKHVRQQLKQTVQRMQTQLKQEAMTHWQEVLQKANHTLQRDYVLKLSSGLKEPVTKEKLLACYLQANEVDYLNATALDSEACQALHQLMHQCVTTDVHQQHMTRLLEALAAVDENHPQTAQLESIAQILMSKNLPKAENDPALMLFQQQENILLRDRQLDALKNLLSRHSDDPHQFHQAIEKVIMGGGKSKVILPLLAQLKANGSNLVIVEVPRALLATNHTDLNFTSQKLFGQKAHRFEFDRDSDCSPERLQEIYQRFLTIKTNKDYLVTTGEAMQSLELKCLELLLNKPTNTQERFNWEKQVYWAGQITQLIKQNGDAVIDEVHKGLWRTQKLNYTLGTEQAVSNESVRHTVALYQFLDIITDQVHGPIAEGQAFKQRMASDWPLCFPVLVEQLLTHRSSPIAQEIRPLIARYGKEKTIEALTAYFNEQAISTTVAISPIITTANKPLQDLLAFYKEQTHLLPRTLSRHYKEHYGPSKSADLSLLNRTIAIPYLANDKPNERSRFGNTLETMNYTTQGLLIEGLTESLLVEIIGQWQIEARYEFQNQPDIYQNLSETPTALGVDMLYLSELGLDLAHVNPKNKAQIAQIYTHLRHNKTLIGEILRDRILPQVTNEPAILHSDAYNHVSMYRSAQGLSGTPWNHATYHQNLKFNHHTSLGTDGYIQTVLSKNKTPVHGVDFDNIETYLPRLFQKVQDPAKVRAIMDISASFEGLDNLTVATALTDYLASYHLDIKYVLYFNEQDVLCALSTEKPHQSITIGSSNPDDIRRKLNCSSENYFTYYDQAHTIGIDIQQALGSTGICLVNEKTTLQHLLQGVMRMRDVGKTQLIEIFGSEAMSPISVDELMQMMSHNQTAQLQEDVANSTPEKMENILRDDLLKRIYALPPEDSELRHRYAKAFEPFFVEIQKTSLFEQYGDLYSEQSTAEIFERDKNRLLTAWENCLAPLDLPANRLDMDQQMQNIIINDLPLCKPTILTQTQASQQDREVEKQKEVARQIDAVIEIEVFNPDLKELPYAEWSSSRLEELLEGKMLFPIGYQSEYRRDLAITPINHALVSRATTMESITLSPQIMVSNNYKDVYHGQTHMLCGYLKPVHMIMYYKIGDALFACVITNQEAQEITQLLQEKLPNTPIWLCTTQNRVLAGHAAETLLNDPNYPLLNEQLRFFGGKALELVEDEKEFTWLNTDTVKKMQFFERCIMPYRDTMPDQYRQLQLAFSKKTEGFDYIAAHAFDDLSQTEWFDIIPDAFPADISACFMLAKAFDYANDTYQTSVLDLKQLHKKFSLTPAAVMYLKKHVTYLNTVKTILEKIFATIPTEDYVANITAEEKTFLQQLLHIDFASFGENKTTVRKNFDLLRLVKNSPVVRHKTALTEVIKKSVILQNIEELRDLAKQKDLLDGDIECISLHPAADKPFIHLLINKASSEATLFNLINHPTTDESHLYRLFFVDHLADLRTDQIRHDIIIHPKTTTRLLNTMLSQSPLPETQLQSMLDKKELPESFLIQIIDKATDAATLQKAIQHPNASTALFDKMMAHRLFTTELGGNILAEIQDTPNNAKTISALLKHSQAVESWWLNTLQRTELQAHHTLAFNTYLQTETVSLSQYERLSKVVMLAENVPAVDASAVDGPDAAAVEEQEKVVIRQHSDVLFGHLLTSLAKEDSQELLLSYLLVQNKDHHARLKNILTDFTLNETQLKSILQNAQQPLSADVLNLLVDKTADEALVLNVLDNLKPPVPDTTSNAVYHHLLTATPWATQSQTLWRVLDAIRTTQNPPPVDNVFHVLAKQSSHYFNKAQALDFLKQCTLNFEPLPRQHDDLMKAHSAMKKLQAKAIQFCEQTGEDPDGRYLRAAQASFELYALLHNIARNHAKHPGSQASLTAQVQQAIEHYEPELKQHRGLKQLLVDILCFLPNLIMYACQGFKGNFRFFKANTQSGEIVDEIKTSIRPQPGE